MQIIITRYKNLKLPWGDTNLLKNDNTQILETLLNQYLLCKYYGPRFDNLEINLITEDKYRDYFKIITTNQFESYKFSKYLKIKFYYPISEVLSLAEVKDLYLKIIDVLAKVPNDIEGLAYNDFVKDFGNLSSEIDRLDVKKYLEETPQIIKSNNLSFNEFYEEIRKKYPKPITKRFKDIRVYSSFEPKALAPYSTAYCEFLRSFYYDKKLLCPEYSHIYIYISDTYKGARNYHNTSTWSEYTYAVIDFEAFKTGNKEEKANLILDAIEFGLNRLVEIDDLNKDVIEDGIKEARKLSIDQVEKIYNDLMKEIRERLEN